jgi:hypothetical protein
MGFTSFDDLINELTVNGKRYRADWNKITGAAAYTANRWYDLSGLGGVPVANSFPGSARAWVSCNESAGNGTDIFGIGHGGNVAADTKHLINMMAVSAIATAVPSVLMLCDMQGYYPGIDMNVNTLQTLTGTPTLRYTNGVGVRAFLVARATTGGSAHNFAYNYNNQAGAAKANPLTVACTTGAIVPHIPHSGSAANNYGPFLPLAGGDTGIQQFNNVQLSAASGSASTAALVLTVPIMQIPLVTAGVAAERDLVNQFPSMPQIKDGACLHWLLFTGAAVVANTNFNGALEMGWS